MITKLGALIRSMQVALKIVTVTVPIICQLLFFTTAAYAQTKQNHQAIDHTIMSNDHSQKDSDTEDLISLNFYQTDVAIILQSLADSQAMNLVMSEPLEIKQTLKLENVAWDRALEIVLKSAKLEADIEDNILWIKKAPDPEQLYQQQRQDEQKRAENRPLESLSLTVDHADLAAVVTAIQQQGLLSERGSVIIDKRTNSVIVKEAKQQFAAIEKLVNELDRAMPQVKISAHIVTMSSESLSELGIKWGYSGSSSQLVDKFNIGLGVPAPTSSIGFNLAKRSGNLLNLELSALESENQLEIIASPNLITANQNMASIKQGTEIPYEVSNGSNGQTTIEFKQAVLGLEVTPRILANDQLMLNLYITQNSAGRAVKRSDGGEALAIDTQEIKTQIVVKNGETVVLGGIFQQLNSKNSNDVPGVSTLPLIGNLFKNNGSKQQKRELVIFITPQLVE